MTDNLTDFTVTLKMARSTGSLADEAEHRTFTTSGPARNAKQAEAIAFGLGHGINEASGYAWKFCGGSDAIVVQPAVVEQTELDKLRAEVAAARAERDEYAHDNRRVVAQLTAANHHTDGLAADVRDMQKANTAYANEVAELRRERDDARRLADLTAEQVAANAQIIVDTRAERDALMPVVEAAKAWVGSSVADFGRTGDALTDAVNALTEAGVA